MQNIVDCVVTITHRERKGALTVPNPGALLQAAADDVEADAYANGHGGPGLHSDTARKLMVPSTSMFQPSTARLHKEFFKTVVEELRSGTASEPVANAYATDGILWEEKPGVYAKILLDDLVIGGLFRVLVGSNANISLSSLVSALMALAIPKFRSEAAADHDSEADDADDFSLELVFENQAFNTMNVMSNGTFAKLCLKPDSKTIFFTRLVRSMKYYTEKTIDDSCNLTGGDVFLLCCKNGCAVVEDPGNLLGCSVILPDPGTGVYACPVGWKCPHCKISDVAATRYSTIAQYIRELDANGDVLEELSAEIVALGSDAPMANSTENKIFRNAFDGEVFRVLKERIAADKRVPNFSCRDVVIGDNSDGCNVGRGISTVPMHIRVFNSDLLRGKGSTRRISDNIHTVVIMGRSRKVKSISSFVMAMVIELQLLRARGVRCRSGVRRVFSIATMQDLIGLKDSVGWIGPAGIRSCERCNLPSGVGSDNFSTGPEKARRSRGADAMRQGGVPVSEIWHNVAEVCDLEAFYRDDDFMQRLCVQFTSSASKTDLKNALYLSGFSQSFLAGSKGGLSAFFFAPYSLFPHYYVSQDMMHKIRNVWKNIYRPLMVYSELNLFGEPHIRRIAKRLQYTIVPSFADAPPIFPHKKERESHAAKDFLTAALEMEMICMYAPALFLGAGLHSGICLDFYYSLCVLGWCFHVLRNDEVSYADLKKVDICLMRVFVFISDFMEAKNRTVQATIHGLVHLVHSVLLWGPLRYLWTFAFERYHQILKRIRTSTKHSGASIAKNHGRRKRQRSLVFVEHAHLERTRKIVELRETEENMNWNPEYSPPDVPLRDIPGSTIDWSQCFQAENENYFTHPIRSTRTALAAGSSSSRQPSANADLFDCVTSYFGQSARDSGSLSVDAMLECIDDADLLSLSTTEEVNISFYKSVYKRCGVEDLGSDMSIPLHSVSFYSDRSTGRHTPGDESLMRSCNVLVDYGTSGKFPAKILFYCVVTIYNRATKKVLRSVGFARARFLLFDSGSNHELITECITEAGKFETKKKQGVTTYSKSCTSFSQYTNAADKWRDICPVLSTATYPLTFPVCFGDASLEHEPLLHPDGSDPDQWIPVDSIEQHVYLVPCGCMPGCEMDNITGDVRNLFDERRAHYAFFPATEPYKY